MGTSMNFSFKEPLKRVQMQGARNFATGAYMRVGEDREISGNAADGPFLEVPI
jgi:hypothetical protein